MMARMAKLAMALLVQCCATVHESEDCGVTENEASMKQATVELHKFETEDVQSVDNTSQDSATGTNAKVGCLDQPVEVWNPNIANMGDDVYTFAFSSITSAAWEWGDGMWAKIISRRGRTRYCRKAGWNEYYHNISAGTERYELFFDSCCSDEPPCSNPERFSRKDYEDAHQRGPEWISDEFVAHQGRAERYQWHCVMANDIAQQSRVYEGIRNFNPMQCDVLAHYLSTQGNLAAMEARTHALGLGAKAISTIGVSAEGLHALHQISEAAAESIATAAAVGDVKLDSAEIASDFVVVEPAHHKAHHASTHLPHHMDLNVVVEKEHKSEFEKGLEKGMKGLGLVVLVATVASLSGVAVPGLIAGHVFVVLAGFPLQWNEFRKAQKLRLQFQEISEISWAICPQTYPCTGFSTKLYGDPGVGEQAVVVQEFESKGGEPWHENTYIRIGDAGNYPEFCKLEADPVEHSGGVGPRHPLHDVVLDRCCDEPPCHDGDSKGLQRARAHDEQVVEWTCIGSLPALRQLRVTPQGTMSFEECEAMWNDNRDVQFVLEVLQRRCLHHPEFAYHYAEADGSPYILGSTCTSLHPCLPQRGAVTCSGAMNGRCKCVPGAALAMRDGRTVCV